MNYKKFLINLSNNFKVKEDALRLIVKKLKSINFNFYGTNMSYNIGLQNIRTSILYDIENNKKFYTIIFLIRQNLEQDYFYKLIIDNDINLIFHVLYNAEGDKLVFKDNKDIFKDNKDIFKDNKDIFKDNKDIFKDNKDIFKDSLTLNELKECYLKKLKYYYTEESIEFKNIYHLEYVQLIKQLNFKKKWLEYAFIQTELLNDFRIKDVMSASIKDNWIEDYALIKNSECEIIDDISFYDKTWYLT